jgi:ligand-binding sensor domain-containing protein
MTGRLRRVALALSLPPLAGAPAAAERLPIAAQTTADGLAHDHVRCVVPDSHGFLWFCTAQGLSRFDGRRFVTFGAAHGLTELYVNDFLQAPDGRYWVATNGGGVYHLDPGGPGRPSSFTQHLLAASGGANRVNVLFLEGAELWAGTDDGLYRRALPAGARFARVELPDHHPDASQVSQFAPARDGGFWVTTSAAILRARGGEMTRLALPAEAARPVAVLEDGEGRLWIGHARGLLVLAPGHARLAPPPLPHIVTRDPFGAESVAALRAHSDGQVYVGFRGAGLGAWDGHRLRRYARGQGLTDEVVTAFAEDRDGNLWIGTETGGALRVARHGFHSLDAADGLAHERVVSVFETRAGELCVLTAGQFLNLWNGSRFAPVRPALPAPPSLLWTHSTLQDREGGWWVATERGLARYAPQRSVLGLAGQQPVAVYTRRHGLAADSVARPFEDARGDVWVFYLARGGLARWERSTGRFHTYAEADGLPADRFMALGEDAQGRLWAGFRNGGLARWTGQRFQLFGPGHGVPSVPVRNLFRDSTGVLWAATLGGGLLRVEATPEGAPRFSRLTTADGLTSDHVRAVTGDAHGRLYLGTALGVDRLDPRTGAVTHYTTADGLAQNEIQAAYHDGQGALWFGTMRGVSRWVPPAEARAPTTPVLIGAVLVGGSPVPMSSVGQRDVSGIEVAPGRGGVRIEYLGLAYAPGSRPRFQYRLANGAGGWSATTSETAVEYAALSPGRYRFEVRSMAAGAASEVATVHFEVLPPLWRRGWFLAALLAAVAWVSYRLHRYRLKRLLELEHVRTRIASDLHDDIGSSLSHIAILSELARRRMGQHDPDAQELLAGIATASRETVDSMSDIVWAIDPEQDHVQDLVHRMRVFGTEVFRARSLEFQLEAAVPEKGLAMGADVRRHVFLIFKEAVNNAARHSACRTALATARIEDGHLHVALRDDGTGFDAERARTGHGLGSMQARAREVGGHLDLRTRPGHGTTVTLRVPL